MKPDPAGGCTSSLSHANTRDVIAAERATTTTNATVIKASASTDTKTR
jgi:hypothetical protein